MTLVIRDAAREDVAQSIRYYDSRPGQHGAAFRDEFLAAVARIPDGPRFFPRVEDAPDGYEVREVYIDRFRQRVLYRLIGDEARVFAVVHASASPRRWLPRLAADDPTE
jgi:plasmid stabilization system protein ParE